MSNDNFVQYKGNIESKQESGLLLYRQVAIGISLLLAASLLAALVILDIDDIHNRWILVAHTLTTVASVGLVYVLYQSNFFHRFPRIAVALTAIYTVSSLLVFLDLWIIANLLLNSDRFPLSASILLILIGIIVIAFGYFISETLVSEIVKINRAAKEITNGNLDVRLPSSGRGELSDLALTFNEMAEQLEISNRNRMETKAVRQNLVAWVGHDLRTPLASLRALIDAVQEEIVDDPATRARYLRSAQDQVQTLSLLVENLLDMVNLNANEVRLVIQTIDINDLVSDAIESFSALSKQLQIELSGNVPTHIPPVRVDSAQIERVMEQLLSNAIRFTPAGGSVCIGVALTSDQRAISIAVTDTGQGISEDDLPYIFEQFYRSEKDRNTVTGGIGVGLTIAKLIVEAHGGEVFAKSKTSVGTTIGFLLPLE